MENAGPLVSIIIPTRNRSNLLYETLLSVQAQIYTNWECLIVDDRSVDDTEKLVRTFSESDKRIKFIIKPQTYQKGAPTSRNLGFSLSKGDYIQWLDDDDLLSKNKILKQVEALELINNSNIYATCSWDLFWPNKKLDLKDNFYDLEKIDKTLFFKKLGENQSFIPPLAYLTPRNLIIKSGLWNMELSINQDAEYFTRIMLNSDYILNVKDCYVLYRQHEGSRISLRKEKNNIESFFLSLNLIQSYLKAYDIKAENYFKWKLLKWYLAYRKIYPDLMRKHYFLFKENGIDINYSMYYSLKHSIYKIVWPRLKKIRNNKL